MKRIRISPLEPIKDLFEGDPVERNKAIKYVLEGTVEPPWWLVCITSGADFPIFNPDQMKHIRCLGVLPIAFDDLIPSRKYWGSPGKWDKSIEFTYRMPTNNHANRIIQLLDNVHQSERLVVNCEAGISRSAAVAYFAAEYMGLNPDDLFDHDRYSPNPIVVALLKEAAGFKSLDESWELLKNNPKCHIPYKEQKS